MATNAHCHLDPEILNLDGGLFSAGQHAHRSIHWRDWLTGLPPADPPDEAAEIPWLLPVDLTQMIPAQPAEPPAPPAPVAVSADRADFPVQSRRRLRRARPGWMAAIALGVLLVAGLAAASQLRKKPPRTRSLPETGHHAPNAAAEPTPHNASAFGTGRDAAAHLH